VDDITRAATAQLGGTRRGRLLTAAFDSSLGVLRSAARSLHSLWLEITGFFFVVFAALGAAACWKEYRDYAATGSGPERLAVTILFTVMFAWFGITSFRRARRKSQS
jgi:hypothetical protein